MHLAIKSNSEDRLEDFISRFVIPNIQICFLNKLNNNHLTRWDKYLKNQFPQVLKNTSAQDIICQGMSNLIYRKYGDRYIISIDPNKNIAGTFAKLYDLCSIINYGNLEISPYPIFEDTFLEIVNLLPSMFEEYIDFLQGV